VAKCDLSEANRFQRVIATSYKAEQDFAIGHLAYTPYLDGEVFYDTRYGASSQNRYSVGVQIPAGSHVVLDTYFLRQNQNRSTPQHVNVIGLRFRFYS
jgi:hypothetical protein